MDADLPNQNPNATERELILELETRQAKLNDQARIFLPLIALAVITAIPVLSKSPIRFLLLLLNPFVLLPVGFCIFHLLLAWRGIAQAKKSMREGERRRGVG